MRMRIGIAAVLLAGCAGSGVREVAPPSTIPVVRKLQIAREGATKARSSLAEARKGVEELRRTAAPAQAPVAERTLRALDGADAEMAAVARALEASDRQAAVLQGRIDGLADDLGRALDAERRSRRAGAYWRAWVLRLGLLSAALGLWTLRRPIVALLGGRVL